MGARVPHTVRRRPSGIYHARLHWPASVRQKLPDLGPELTFSLATAHTNEARRIIYDAMCLFRQLVVFIGFNFDKMGSEATMDQVAERIDALKQSLTRNRLMPIAMPERPRANPPTFHPGIQIIRGAEQTPPTPHGHAIENRTVIEVLPDGAQRVYSDLADPDAANRELAAYFGLLAQGNHHGPTGEAITVRQVAKEFAEEQVSAGKWNDASTRQNRLYRLDQIVSHLGADTPWSQLTRQDAKRYRQHLITCYEAHLNDSADCEQLQSRTAEAYFQLFKSLVEFAWAEGYHTRDIARHLLLSLPKSSNAYPSFEASDIHQILHSYLYTNTEIPGHHPQAYISAYFWLPLLGPYTGARLNELCQLRVEDVRCLGGIWYLSITEDDPQANKERQKSLKTEASRRSVPLHAAILNAGFLEFLAERRAADGEHGQLFEDLTWDPKNKFGKKAGRWYNEKFLKKIGLATPERKCFHSNRHTVTQHLYSEHDEPDEKIACIVGHEGKTTTSKYGKDINLTTLRWLKSKIDLIDYGVSTDHIHWARYKEFQACVGRPVKKAHLLRAYRAKQARTPHTP
ncbi:site-specific integrase [Motiliproteus sp. SC1-56]|uniref:site-specific integrase n=1 Tax=Motiliproteus sp. SC1-56 TaxID=2799565 RepID=UPI001A8D56D3|nr:site-specific integrase [Motiliproteus sp. SC1-56]